MIRAAFFDFGGVVTTSPFDAFASYEQRSGLPVGFIRMLNSTDPDTNAWARLERNELDVDGFALAFELEARAAGHSVDGRAVLSCLAGDLRPAMLTAIERCRERMTVAVLTNNFLPDPSPSSGNASAMREWRIPAFADLFDVVVESAKVGMRKPDPAFYALACELAEVEPTEVVFLDDLGVNLKPARELGMTTIKVEDPAVALEELERVVGFPVA
ncbi:MAG TPA: HAD-IA family hydrolase [Microthrixaceae bacterium]|nr:HAD-IA family hydrolase [Microthrixaceae bacterium]